MRGRLVVAAVAAGAFAAAGQAMAADDDRADSSPDEYTPLASEQDLAASFGTVVEGEGSANANTTAHGVGGKAPAPQMLPVAQPANTDDQLRQLDKSQRVAKQHAEAAARRRAAIREARQPDYVAPTTGRLTSGFGGRWGTIHYGIDIANDIGTGIVAVAEGRVIEAGPASGFGLWVRVQHPDGTVTVYGHIHSITVQEGEWVEAGEQIATMGNRGFSTGSHLHFEVWAPSGKKINPLPWLREHNIDIT